MAVTHTEGVGLTMLDLLLLARDRCMVVLSPELETADLLTSAWQSWQWEADLTHHYEVELILGDDGVVTLVPRRIGTRAVKEPLTLVAAVKGVWSDEDYTATICAHLELGERSRWGVEAYTQESVDKLGFFPAPMSLRNHLLEPDYLSNLVLEHIQYLIEEPHGRRASWL